ncbi:hypothetical protein N431DRAFT_356145 [Stipitochalara longipes BDJ]|nr:hypothetical protein N431DRAFT_356145 [Stipitochalara longipes BDJ]
MKMTHAHPETLTIMASTTNIKNSSIPAKMASMAQGRMSQAPPANEDQIKRPRWSDDEDKTLCDILKTQWQLEKDSLGKLNGTKFWPLVSAKLKKCGFDRSSDQCRSYWYGAIRLRPEFKDTLQFRGFNERHSTPLAMTSNTGTDITSGSSKIGASTAQSLYSTDTDESKSRARSAFSSLSNAGAEHETPRTKSGGTDTPSSSMSQTAKDNASMARWTDHETQKLHELVLAKRSSMTEDHKELGAPFWTSISQELANIQIDRTWQACARRFQRTNQGSYAAESGLPSDDAAGNPMPGKLYHVEPNNEDTEVEDGGSRLGLDNGDTPYGEDGEPRRGTRKRVSKPAWSDEEHNRLVQLMKARRELESEDENLEKLSNNKLFGLVSKQLKQYLIDRSAGACNLYWNNKGSARSDLNIDPRAPCSDGMSRKSSGEGGLSAMQEFSPVAKDIEDAYDRLPQQDFDDSPFVQSFLKV